MGKYLVKLLPVVLGNNFSNDILALMENVEKEKLSNMFYLLFGFIWQRIIRGNEIRKELSRNERE